MSQLLQQNDGPADTQRYHTHDTIASRNHTHYTQSTTPFSSDAGKRSQRKAAPSPLQTSTTATNNPNTTPTRSTFSDRRTAEQFTSPQGKNLQEEPRSPKERLNDLLASEKSFYNTGDSKLGAISEEKNIRSNRSWLDTNGSSRSVSDPVLKSIPPESSTSSTRAAMTTMASSHRAEMARGPPRTSSIDSAISSVSGSTHSPKSSQDMKSTSPPDIVKLIEAAGGADILIGHLLKEKRSQNAQNAQLWRLVDKQRAMILGLNKDLDRTMKDKEKYKKELKDVLAQPSNPSPVDSNQGLGSEIGSISSDSRTTDMTRADSIGTIVSLTGVKALEQDQQHSPIDVALAPYPITPPATYSQSPALSNMIEAQHKMPSPTQHAFQQYNPDAPIYGFESGQQQRKGSEVNREVPYNAMLPPSRPTLPSNPPRGPPPSIPPPKAPMSSQTPSLNLIHPSPNPNEGMRVFSPPRKAPPAPLNLGKQINASSHLRQASGASDETDSDYDDILEVDELPAFTERGRRKTREQDDKEREIAVMKEAEMRSLSKKSGQGNSKSRPTTPKEAPPAFNQSLSPRQTIPISPPHVHSRHMSPEENSGSLAGVLSDASNGFNAPLMSPGLPLSPRPMDRPLGSPLPRHVSSSTMNSPPMSPRGMGAFPAAVPLSPRAPRQAIALPPNTPMSISSPGGLKGEPLQLISPKALNIPSKKTGDSNVNSRDENSPIPSLVTPSNAIYRGLVTDEYPDLLLPPNALPSIEVRVASSRLKPSRASIMFPKNFEEDPVFTLAVFSRSDGMELWRVEKDSSSLSQLDQVLKQSPHFTAKTPERSLFSGHAPAKVDARRVALDRYLEEILNTQMEMASALELCRYLSTNAMEPHAEEFAPGGESGSVSPVKTGPGGRPLRNGYLTKRGKNFGGWKARFFVLDGPVLKYYESPGGPHLGTIKLQNAQIGKQQQQTDHSPSRGDTEDPDNQYRHAFLILEPKRKDSSSLLRHVLCAESDQERDLWVEALLRYVDFKDEEEEDQSQSRQQQHARTASNGSGNSGPPKASGGKSSSGKSKKKSQNQMPRSQTMPDLADDSLRGVSYETTKQGNYPVNSRMKNSDTPSPPAYGNERDPMSQLSQNQSGKNISAPKNAQVIQDSAQRGSKPNQLLAPAYDDKIKQKKRSFFGFGTKVKSPYETHEVHSSDGTSSLSQMAYDQHGPIRPAFGASLGEAVKYNHPVDNSIELPAVIFRCIEYLDAKNACNEEGIFRLSGSNVVIKQLRERFNVEGDVNLVTDEQYYDIHAVASLLKLYLRELPSTILTRELHLEFLAVTELHDLQDKIKALNGLVHRLPRANHALLRYLSGFLINIINHADINKMTVRNVGIVFSPTLNIPALVFALFLQQYDGIFEEEPHEHNVEVMVTAPPLSPEDIRSPRRQKFQPDLPTPSYDQQHFQGNPMQQQHGFTPIQPSYEQSPQPGLMAGPEYGRSAQTLRGPSYDQYGANNEYPQSSKSKRRESTMSGVNMNGPTRKVSSNRLNDPRLVDDESFFD